MQPKVSDIYSVVVVDDHPAICLAVKATLEAAGGFEVVGEAASGQPALAIIRERSPTLVILDLDLPGMSGLSLIGRIRAERPDIKVLVLSAQQETIFATRAMQAGASGFISKNEDMHKMAEAAQSVLAGYSVFPTAAIASFTNTGASPLSSLTDRELAVLQHLARGMNNRDIGELLLISNKTVSTFKARIFEKLGISTIVELVDFARRHQLIA
jgi:DNA-binding NarL/FixJ family response regulator